MNIRAGRLKDKVTIEAPPTADSRGQLVGSWSTVATRRCAIEPLNGREYWSRLGEQVNAIVMIRFRFELNLIQYSYRLVDYRDSPAVIYEVIEIINDRNRNRELIVKAQRLI